MVLQKQDGGIRPILCGEVWRPCVESLVVNVTPVRDGASYCTKILSVFYDNLDTSDPNDPEVIIKIDISNAFNTTCRTLTLDFLSGRASRDYACGLKHGDVIPTCENLSNLFGYFKVMHTCHAKLWYFDWDGQVHLGKGKTGGQQGDP
jgi:hypothetical protein